MSLTSVPLSQTSKTLEVPLISAWICRSYHVFNASVVTLVASCPAVTWFFLTSAPLLFRLSEDDVRSGTAPRKRSTGVVPPC